MHWNPLKTRQYRWACFWLAAIMTAIVACGDDAPNALPATARHPAAAVQGTIVAMGDSLTAGLGLTEAEAYPAIVAKRLAANGYDFRVINAGVSGETSSGALARLDWILKLSPDIVILETGANDGLRGLDTEQMAANIDALVAGFQQKGVIVILAGMKMVRNLGPEYVARFEAVYPRIVRRRQPIFIPFFLEGVAGRPSLNLDDGLHPNAEGHRIVADLVYPAVVAAISKLPLK